MNENRVKKFCSGTSLTGLPDPHEAWTGEGQGLNSENCHTNLKCLLVISITFIIRKEHESGI